MIAVHWRAVTRIATGAPRQQDARLARFQPRGVEQFRATGGIGPGRWATQPLLLLTTTGARSGLPRTTPLLYSTDGDRFVVIASKGGEPTHPDWYHNLLAHPEATVEVGAETFPVHAHVAQGAERRRLFDQQAAQIPFSRVSTHHSPHHPSRGAHPPHLLRLTITALPLPRLRWSTSVALRDSESSWFQITRLFPGYRNRVSHCGMEAQDSERCSRSGRTSRAASSAVNRSTIGSTCSLHPREHDASRRPATPRRHRCSRESARANCVHHHVRFWFMITVTASSTTIILM